MARMYPKKAARLLPWKAPRIFAMIGRCPTFCDVVSKSGLPLRIRGRRRVPHVFDAARQQYASTQDRYCGRTLHDPE